MSTYRNWFHVGGDQALAAVLARELGAPAAGGEAGTAGPGDLVVVEAFADLGGRPDVPGGHAFALCRSLKLRPGPAVAVVVRTDDPVGPQVARFCLADASLVWDGKGQLRGLEALASGRPSRGRTTVDQLLDRYARLVAEPGRTASALQKLRQWEREDDLLHRLQDADTGLLDGPYASLKLDEEYKRAVRFHLPLSLVLLEVGSELPPPGPERRELLAEVAGVFLNECRDIDVLARFTETTFLFLLPGTGQDGATVLAHRMLDRLRQRPFAGRRLSPCAGLCTVPAAGIADRQEFLAAAELGLRRAQAGEGDGGLCAAWE